MSIADELYPLVIGCVHEDGKPVGVGDCKDPECLNCPDYRYKDVPHISGVPIHKFGTHDILQEKIDELKKELANVQTELRFWRGY